MNNKLLKTNKKTRPIVLNLIYCFFILNIFLQIYQTFFTGTYFSIPINLFGLNIWIRSLGFFAVPSSCGIASLSILCFFSHIYYKEKFVDYKDFKIKFTLFYFIPCVFSILLTASGTAIIGLFIYYLFSDSKLILKIHPSIKQARIFAKSNLFFIIYMIPLLIFIYYTLPYITGRFDVLTSLTGRFNILFGIPDSVKSILPNFSSFGLYTNYYQSSSLSDFVNVSDSVIISFYAQYGLLLSIISLCIYFRFFLKIYINRSKSINNYVNPIVFSFLPIFATTNLIENYLSLTCLLLCLEPISRLKNEKIM
tara:strand:+ start:198 stop:1124 length:927 start_codon:yes stop_codon:yes gene_type:complete